MNGTTQADSIAQHSRGKKLVMYNSTDIVNRWLMKYSCGKFFHDRMKFSDFKNCLKCTA